MRSFVFAKRYPVPFKPYYDTQFADLVERGHDLTIFSAGALDEDTLNEKVLRHGLHQKTRRYPVTLRTLPLAAGSYLRGGLRRPASSLRAAGAVVSGGNGSSPKAALMDVARLVAVNAGRPDLCLVHGLGTAVLFRWLPDAFPGTPVAMYYHGGEVPTNEALERPEVAETFDRMDVVFTNTRFSRDHAVSRGCPADKIHILPVGFDLRDFGPPPEKPADGPLRLLSAGRMSEEKGHIYALKALRDLLDRGVEDVVYSMTGEGYVRPRLEAFVDEHDLGDHVRFLGTLSTRGVMDAMREAHVLLLPSIQVGNWVENQACAVQESMMHRCLAVTTRTGGVPESIPECMRHFSVEEKDVGGLADSLERIARMPAAERDELADRCREFVERNYDIRRLNERMLDTIRREAARSELSA